MIQIPRPIVDLLDQGAHLAISISGGKDSQVMLNLLADFAHERGLTSRTFCIHADLGRAEHPDTLPYVRHLAETADLPLVIVRRSDGKDLVSRIEDRFQKLKGTGKPFWPSSQSRYCTSDLKRLPINQYLRRFDRVISCEGIRAEESQTRLHKPVLEVRRDLTGQKHFPITSRKPFKRGKTITPEQLAASTAEGRKALTWNPILDFQLPDVWTACNTSAQEIQRLRLLYLSDPVAALTNPPVHPAYIRGNVRVSCALCILASKADLLNGIRHHRSLAEHYSELEQQSGFSFTEGFSITEALQNPERQGSLFGDGFRQP